MVAPLEGGDGASPPEPPPPACSPADALAAEAPAAEAQLPDEQPSEFQASVERAREGWFARLRAGLSRSSNRLRDNISGILTKRRLDAEVLEELEEALITADLGVEAAAELTADLGRPGLARKSRTRRCGVRSPSPSPPFSSRSPGRCSSTRRIGHT